MEMWKDYYRYTHVKAPIEMCNYVVRMNLENPFRLFLYLKINYPSGKLNWTLKERKKASLFLKVNIKTITNNFDRIKNLEWLIFHENRKYCRIISFDKIRVLYGWFRRSSFTFSIETILNTRAILGAILYTQLFKSYSRKYLKRNKNVQQNGCANNFITPSCKYKDYAEVSVISISKIFNISISKAVRLKQLAVKEGLIIVKKQYYYLDQDEVLAAMKNREYNEKSNNIVCRKGKYAYQLTDKIYSEMYFKKRKKLKTL